MEEVMFNLGDLIGFVSAAVAYGMLRGRVQQSAKVTDAIQDLGTIAVVQQNVENIKRVEGRLEKAEDEIFKRLRDIEQGQAQIDADIKIVIQMLKTQNSQYVKYSECGSCQPRRRSTDDQD